MRVFKSLVLMVLCVGTMHSQDGPGGVGNNTNNILWLKADSATTIATGVSAWRDQSGNGNNAAQGTAGSQALLLTNQLNGFPVLDLDATDDHLTVSGISVSDLTTNGFTFAVVFKLDDVTGVKTILDVGESTLDFIYIYVSGTSLRIIEDGTRVELNTMAAETWYTAVFRRTSGGVYSLTLNGVDQTLSAMADATINPNSALSIAYAPTEANYPINGQIAEFILYDEELNDVNHVLLNNYLANKYAQTLGVDVTDYYAYQATHQFDLAGLGRDGIPNSNISANSGLMNINIASIGTDDSYAIFGHNDGATSYIAAEVPDDSIAGKLGREWVLDRNNSAIATVNFSADSAEIPFATLNSKMDYKLLLDGDGDFSSGVTVHDLTLSSGQYTASSIAISDNQYMSIGLMIDQPSDAPTSLVLNNIAIDSIDVSYTAAVSAPDGYIVLRQAGSSVLDKPQDLIAYSVGEAIGDATVAYVGTSVSFTDSALNSGTNYYYAVFSYNGLGSNLNYLQSSSLSGNATTTSTDMAYVSSTTVQNTDILIPGSSEEMIIGIKIVMSGNTNALDLTQLVLNTSGTENAATNIANAKAFYTGSTNPFGNVSKTGNVVFRKKAKNGDGEVVAFNRPIKLFRKYDFQKGRFVESNDNGSLIGDISEKSPQGSTQFGSTVASPNGSFTFNDTQTLSQDTNYIWITYDILSGGIIDDSVDVEFTQATINSITRTPTESDPVGARIIQSYCTIGFETYTDEYVKNVSFSNINNASGNNAYTDFTSSVSAAVVYVGNSYDLSVTIASDYDDYVRVWFDWNNDGDFVDAGEAVDVVALTNSEGPHTVSIDIPESATLGTTRMRVSVRWDGYPDPCENAGGTYGEAEDYEIEIKQEVTMSFASIEVAQNVHPVDTNSTNQQIISINVITEGVSNALNATQLNFNTTGTTSTSDIANGKLFYTGTSAVFDTTTQYSSTVAAPNGAFSINGSQVLESGNNFFWLTYDVNSAATLTNEIDAIFSSAIINSITRTSTDSNPSGSREIRTLLNISDGGSTTLTSGTLYDDGGPDGNYSISSDLTYTISPTNAAFVKVQFTEFDFDNSSSRTVYDTLFIYDTDGTTLIGAYTDNVSLPNNGDFITSTDSAIVIRQQTSDQTERLGFEMNWETITAAGMAYSSSTVVQDTSIVGIGFTDQKVIGLEVVTTGSSSAINLTSIEANTAGTSAANISNAKIYFTGSSSVFSTSGQFSSTIASPNGDMTFNGSQTLVNGTNYFWLTYDISGSGAVDGVVDASISEITVNSSAETPTVTSPSDERTIKIIESFESFPPTNWATGGTGDNWAQTTNQAYNGTNSANAVEGASLNPRYLKGPQVRPTSSNQFLRFWVRKQETSGSDEGNLEIRVSLSDQTDGSFTNIVTTININNIEPNTWTEQIVSLSDYIDSAIYVAFIHDPSSANTGLYLDDVSMPAEVEDVTYDDVPLGTYLLPDNTTNVEVLNFVSNSSSGYTLNSISFENSGDGDLNNVSQLRLFRNSEVSGLDTILDPSASLLMAGIAASISDGDTLKLFADFSDIPYTQTFQFNIANISQMAISTTITNSNFPLSGRSLEHSHSYDITPNNPVGTPSIDANERVLMGHFTISESNNIESVSIQNRVSSGTVNSTDIDSVYIYIGSSTPTLSTEPYAKALFSGVDGGAGTVTLTPAVASSATNFYVVYKLSSGPNFTNAIGIQISSLTLENTMDLNGSFPIDFTSDLTLPVKLLSVLTSSSNTSISIKITTASEYDTEKLLLYRLDDKGNKILVDEKDLIGTISTGSTYILSENDLESGKEYHYEVHEQRIDGIIVVLESDITISTNIPTNYSVGNAYPNPFNPTTNIPFQTPFRSDAVISVYNLLGQLVFKTVQKNLEATEHKFTWDSRNNNGQRVPSSMYFVWFDFLNQKTGERSKFVKKIILIK